MVKQQENGDTHQQTDQGQHSTNGQHPVPDQYKGLIQELQRLLVVDTLPQGLDRHDRLFESFAQTLIGAQRLLQLFVFLLQRFSQSRILRSQLLPFFL